MKNHSMYFKFSLSVLFLIGQLSAAQSSGKTLNSCTYNDTAELLLPALGLTSPTPTPSSAADTHKVDFAQLTTLSDYELYAFIFDLLHKATQNLNHTSLSPVIQVLNSTNMFCFMDGNDLEQRGKSVFSKLVNTTTTLGEANLAYMLAHPTSDLQELKERQSLIRLYVKDPQLTTTCETLLNDLADHERGLFACYKNPTENEKKQVERLFFKKLGLKNFNDNEWALGIYARLGDASVLNPTYLSTAFGVLSIYAVRKAVQRGTQIQDPTANVDRLFSLSFPGICKEAFLNSLQSLNMIKNIKEFHIQRTKVFEANNREIDGLKAKLTTTQDIEAVNILQQEIDAKEFGNNFAKNSNLVYLIGLLGSAGVSLYQYWWMYRNAQHQIDIHAIDAYLQTKLIHCTALLHTFDALMKLAQQHPELQTLAASWQATTPVKSAQFKKLLGMLRSKTFTPHKLPIVLSDIGRIRAAYTLMMETREEFGDMARFVGLCDAHLAIAKLYLKNQKTPAPFCFPQYQKQATPHLKATGFGNVMIDPSKVVLNNLELGLSGSSITRGVVVTGSNSGGKSTIMVNGLTLLIWFAQTLTIAPAKELVFTPFDYITIVSGVRGNIVSGESHFVAETKQAANLINTVKDLGNKKAFVAIDELFEGTKPDVAEASLADALKRLANCSNTVFSVATQYQGEPTLLEEQTQGLCKNMKIDVIKQHDGKIVRPYKLEFGKSEVSVGEQLLQEAMMSEKIAA